MKLWTNNRQQANVNLAQLVQERLSKQSEVRPFPAAVAQLMTALQDPNASSASLAKIVECDPSLAVRLLRMANSPLYGLSREVRSIAHATSMLGTRSLKTLAMSVAGATMFASGSSAATEREKLWQHSLGSAGVARILTEFEPNVSADDAFLACVFHDVGKLLLFDIIPDEYSDMMQTHVGADLVQQEQEMLEVTHSDIGFKSAHAWSLPEDLKVAIGYHHHPANAPAHFELTAIVYVANMLAHAWGIGSSVTPELECDEADSILHQLDFGQEVLSSVKQRAQAAYADTQAVCA